jgi:peptidoglycan/xylan/chitin deacetylase (PgdA/CDA1 family)
MDEVYFQWDDRKVLCAVGLDTVSGNDVDSVNRGLDRAAREGSVLILFTHAPGRTVPVDKLEAIVSHAQDLHLPALTFADLIDGPPQAGYSISFDDNDVDAWWSVRDLLAAHDARVTLFVSRFDRFDDAEREKLRELHAAGHDVEAHTMRHQRAPAYVEEHGLDAYLDDEALPSQDLLADGGYDARAFAYPFGARTSELDDALLQHFALLRSVSFSTGVPGVSDPCPE